jgi:hypothetical protein
MSSLELLPQPSGFSAAVVSGRKWSRPMFAVRTSGIWAQIEQLTDRAWHDGDA